MLSTVRKLTIGIAENLFSIELDALIEGMLAVVFTPNLVNLKYNKINIIDLIAISEKNNATMIVSIFIEIILLQITYGALCGGRSVILAAGPQKVVSWVKALFLDQISKRP